MNISIFGSKYRIIIKKKIFGSGIEKVWNNFRQKTCYNYSESLGNRLKEHCALITGGGTGIGYAIAVRLLGEGSKVIITGRHREALEKTIRQLNHPNLSYMVWDVSDRNNNSENFRKADQIFGKIDILVNNAGVTSDGSGRKHFEKMRDDHFRYVHDINTLGTKNMCEEFVKQHYQGTILNIISNTAIIPAYDAYTSSKWALYAFTQSFGELCLNQNKSITVNGLCPGPVMTRMSFNSTTSLFRNLIPNKRMGLPEEIAELAIVQLICGLNGENGKITICDGGESL